MKLFSIRKMLRKVISSIFCFASPRLADILPCPVSKRLFEKYEEVVQIGGGISLRVYGDMEDMVNKTIFFMSGFTPYSGTLPEGQFFVNAFATMHTERLKGMIV